MRRKKVVKRAVSGVLCMFLAICLYLECGMQGVQAGIIANNASSETKKVYTEKREDYEMGTAENPFTILEIVPNHSMAKIGYLIPGCEPINMSELVKDDAVFGTYRSMFAAGSGEVTAVTIEDVDLKKFADQLPAEATAREPWSSDAAQLMAMAPSDIVWVTQETNFGMWLFRTEEHTQTGYYEYVEDATGFFDMVSTQSREDASQTVYEFVYNENHTGSYQWVEAENVEGKVTDYTADQVWTTRTCNYYFEYMERSIINNDLLIKSAFDTSTEEGFVSQVVTLTPEELAAEENLALIDSVDMIVIGQDAETNIRELWNKMRDDTDLEDVAADAPVNFRQNDVPWAAVKRIVERMVSEEPAALILDKTTYDGAGSTNLMKLAIMLVQYDPTVFMDYYFNQIDGNGIYTDTNGVQHAEWVCSEYPSINTFDLSIAKSKNINLEAGNGVISDNVYAYNGYNIFTHGYEEAKYTETAMNREAFDYFEELYGSRPEALSAKEFVQYILSGYHYRKTIRILEIEPTNLYIYPGDDHIKGYEDVQNYNKHVEGCTDDNCEKCQAWKEYYRKLIPWMRGDMRELVKSGRLEITVMASWEFIGKIEDLNAEYDMIILGATQNAANGVNGYNDSDMDGLIYSNVGDLVVGTGTRGFKDRDMQSSSVLRYSGNDLTEKKLQELKNFLGGGKPVIVDSTFFEKEYSGSSKNVVDKDIVDESSYVYQLLSLAGTEEGTNMYVSDRVDMYGLKSLVSKENCELEFYTEDGGTGYPVEYTYEEEADGMIIADTVTYVDSQTFSYRFRINGRTNQSYGVSLYIDRNGDGIYKGSLKENVLSQSEDSEEITGLTVTDMYGYPVEANQLEAGVWYQVSKGLPSNYVGILPWKLEVYNTDNPKIRDNVVKYSAIKTTAQNRETIKVLQMNPVVNLGTDGSQPEGVIMATTGYGSNDSNAQKFQRYLGAVNDFDVTVEFLTNNAWNAMFGDSSSKSAEEKIEQWKTYLDGYDMLMIGYTDTTQFTSNAVFQAGFEYFVESGKSVILSHDLVKDESYKYDWAGFGAVSNYDDKLRDLMSQRRYNSTYLQLKGKTISLISPQTLEAYQTSGSPTEHRGNLDKYDISSLTTVNEDGNLVPNYGDNSANFYIKYGPLYDERRIGNNIGAKADRDCFLEGQYVSFPYTTNYVNISNSGQITTYPYTLGSIIEVAATHAQYTQLNLDDEDMVVWYSLTDRYSDTYSDEIYTYRKEALDSDKAGRGIYSSRENDVRNNFYIYNVGNITYTGLGHMKSATLPDDEVQLFVNTMISAYRAASDNPYAEVTNEEKIEISKNDAYIYVPVDEGNFDYTNDTYQVELTIKDPSWLQSVTEEKRAYLQLAADENGTVPEEQKIVYDSDTLQVVDTTEISISTGTTDKYVYLQKNNGWGDMVYCYAYSGIDDSLNNSSWPGVAMEKVNDSGLYRYKIPSYIISPKIIFSNGSGGQYPGSGASGISFEGTSMIFTAGANGSWTWESENEETKVETQTAYEVAVDGNYYFDVSYQELLEKGQLEYYLCLKSSYVKNGRTYSNQEVTKVTILPMPLYDLN